MVLASALQWQRRMTAGAWASRHARRCWVQDKVVEKRLILAYQIEKEYGGAMSCGENLRWGLLA